MAIKWKQILPHLGVIIGFILISLLYFSPVLSGKKLYQSDIVWYMGMAKEQIDFRAETGEEPYWTDSAFGGMPTYQLGAKYPHNYIKDLDLALRVLPRPADYLLLYFLSFYVLLLVLRVDWRYAALGSLAFGFSTYLIVILGVGHNAKAHAIGYMPLVLAGILLTFRRKYLWGFILTTLALGLEIVANHLQMTYYLMLLVIVLGISYFIDAARKKLLPHYFKSVGILIVAAILALGLNATSILATQEYTEFSTRSASKLTINPDGSEKEETTGLSKDYINQYSYGKLETLNLFIARLFGGSNDEPFDPDSSFAKALRTQQVPPQQMEPIFNQFGLYYWGGQPGVSGPAYIGAVVVFLFVLGLFLVRGRLKWWLVGGTILSLLLSYGSNLEWFTNLWIDYVPLYDKFRAVTSIQVIAELCVPVLAIMALHKVFNKFDPIESKKKALTWAIGITGGLCVLLLLLSGSGPFDFAGVNDSSIRQIEGIGNLLVQSIRDDRRSLYTNDIIKTLLLIVITSGIIWLYIKEKIKENVALLVIALLICVDLISLARNYVNNDNFVVARQMEQPFEANRADLQIQKDSTRFRVYEENVGIGTSRSSYFHNSIGGYHGAKPKRINDIADFYLYQGKVAPLNLLNVKYIIKENNGSTYAQTNPGAVGNAWFVENVMVVPTENQELLALDSVDVRKTAIVHKEFESYLPANTFKRDSSARITLTAERPNLLKYSYTSDIERLALFSEIYYPEGWNAYVDGERTPHFRADYLLRAMVLPEGTHDIEFRFAPKVIATGSKITIATSLLFLGITLGGGLLFWKRNKRSKAI